MGSEFTVFCSRCPAIVIDLYPPAAGGDHGLDGKYHSGLHDLAASSLAVVRNLRIFVQRPADTVTDKLSHDRKSDGFHTLLHRAGNFVPPPPRPHLINSDLKRAGYWSFSPNLLAPSANPFQSPTNQVHIQTYAGESPDSCILFAYDLDQDGLVGVGRCDDSGCASQTDGDNVEQFGFRLRDARIQSRFGGTDFDCESGYWQTVNDPDIEITQLRFEQRSQCLNLVENNRDCTPRSARLIQGGIEILLNGRLSNKPDTSITLSHWVRIRNDLLREGDSDAN